VSAGIGARRRIAQDVVSDVHLQQEGDVAFLVAWARRAALAQAAAGILSVLAEERC
jgi:hypothetical protein